MFEMEKMGKKIAELRKEKNMTQSEFAEKIGISFQAVSNWERGNSMPDIAKLKDIANIFEVTLDELFDNNESKFLKNVARGEEVKIETNEDKEDLISAAEYIKPDVISNITDGAKNEDIIFSIKDIIDLAPFMNEKSLDRIVEKIKLSGDDKEIKHIRDLAPFLSEETLEKLFKEYLEKGNEVDFKMALAIAPFLESQAIKLLVSRMYIDDTAELSPQLISLAPYMDEKDIESLIKKSINENKEVNISIFGPYISSDFLKDYIRECENPIKAIKNSIYYLEEKEIPVFIKELSKRKDLDYKKLLKASAMYMNPDDIDEILKGRMESIINT